MRWMALLFILLCSTAVFAEETIQQQSISTNLSFNFSSFVEQEGKDISIAKIIGGIVLVFLLISEVYRRRK